MNSGKTVFSQIMDWAPWNDKKNLRIKAFYGTSFNAVCIQIWTAISAYVLIAILKKRLEIDMELYKILQIVSINPFQKVLLYELLTDAVHKT